MQCQSTDETYRPSSGSYSIPWTISNPVPEVCLSLTSRRRNLIADAVVRRHIHDCSTLKEQMGSFR